MNINYSSLPFLVSAADSIPTFRPYLTVIHPSTRLPFRSWLIQGSHRVVEEVLLAQLACLLHVHQKGVGRGCLVRLIHVSYLPDDDTRPQRSLGGVVVP